MTRRHSRLLALAFFLSSPISCGLSFPFMIGRTAPLYYLFSGFSFFLIVLGAITLLARPVKAAPSYRGLASIVVATLVGTRLGLLIGEPSRGQPATGFDP